MSQPTYSKSSIYTRQGLWSLFLMCAFPLHLWTIILVFQDVSWVAERTNAWDAVGVASYAMVFALVESLLVFLIMTLIGFVTPRRWDVNKRVAFLTLLILILAIWGIASQLLFLWNINLSEQVIQFLARSGHPLWYLYGVSLAVVIPTVFVPVYIFLRSDKMSIFIYDLADRLLVLSMFYLLFDLAGIIVLIVRNSN
ncbi:MAG TPA: hypothetical protein DCX53_00045 [Anaerolineae bacterium]|nr:hypothetical protein [Anaerolineae bacterium]